MRRILITGASGLLGANLVLDAAGRHEVIAVTHRHRLERPGVRSFQADLANPGAAQELMPGPPRLGDPLPAATESTRARRIPGGRSG
jgi:nucleoside-diphosphate-sugar epimerase